MQMNLREKLSKFQKVSCDLHRIKLNYTPSPHSHTCTVLINKHKLKILKTSGRPVRFACPEQKKNQFWCVWVQMWSVKNLHHTAGGPYWFLAQYISKLIYWPPLNASAQTNSQLAVTQHHRSILTDCWIPCMSVQQKHTHTHTYVHTRAFTLHPQGRDLWWSDRADTAWPIVHTCWSVPRRGPWRQRGRPASLQTINAFQWEDLAIMFVLGGGWGASLRSVQYVIQNQTNDYLPSPQALTQFWFMIRMNIDFPGWPTLLSLPFLPFLLLTKEWMMYVYWFSINYFYSHFI